MKPHTDASRDAIKAIYRFVEGRLQADDFATIDNLLRYFEPAKMGPSAALAALTITLPAKDKLVTRAKFYEDTRKYLLTIMPVSEAAANLKGLE